MELEEYTDQASINYNRIANAIDFIKNNFKNQPHLDDIAAHVHLSPFHFQKLFSEWAGTSPKKFLQYISLEYAKSLLKNNNCSIEETAFISGLSGSGRLHDLFIGIEGMTPGEYKKGGTNIGINYSFQSTPFGKVIVASTNKGVCYLAFQEDELRAFSDLKTKFPFASLEQKIDLLQQSAIQFFQRDWTNCKELRLHLKGTPFQLKVWEALLKIPMGELSTYGTIAKEIKLPSASRAIGTAIGSNPVAFLIPCHRVIQSTGLLGGYMWGNTRKTAMIGWEGAYSNSQNDSEGKSEE